MLRQAQHERLNLLNLVELITAATATTAAITTESGFFTKRRMLAQTKFDGVWVQGHLRQGQIAALSG